MDDDDDSDVILMGANDNVTDDMILPFALQESHLRGRIVRLGDGPGWLHESARFDSPTLPVRLSESQEVAILGPQQSDDQGTPWLYVAVGGYEGWSPLNNVEELQ